MCSIRLEPLQTLKKNNRVVLTSLEQKSNKEFITFKTTLGALISYELQQHVKILKTCIELADNLGIFGCTDKRATDKNAKKADEKAKNQKYILIVFSIKILFLQCNKTDLELDLFEDVSIFVVWLGRFAPFTK